jgi:hypothetical protein
MLDNQKNTDSKSRFAGIDMGRGKPRPGGRWLIDMVGDVNGESGLRITDASTRRTIFEAADVRTGADVVKALSVAVAAGMPPMEIASDGAMEFQCAELQKWVAAHGVRWLFRACSR